MNQDCSCGWHDKIDEGGAQEQGYHAPVLCWSDSGVFGLVPSWI